MGSAKRQRANDEAGTGAATDADARPATEHGTAGQRRVANAAGIVLAGGRSTRMGTSKAWLEWHGSTCARHVAGIVARAVDGPVVIVRSPGQELPPLPASVELAEDAEPDRGPLQGIAAGLATVGARADAVFVCAVDAPLLHHAFVRHVVAALAGAQIAMPHAGGHPHPLTAAYRTSVATVLHELLADDRLATKLLVARCDTRVLDEASLRADPVLSVLDPELCSLVSLNDRAAYAAARARPAPAVTVVGTGIVRAATLAQAGDGPAIVAGRLVDDPLAPLCEGDRVSFGGRPSTRP